MGFLPNYSVQSRKLSVLPPDNVILSKGIGFFATATILASIAVCNVPGVIRLASLLVGVVLGIISLRYIRRYLSQSKTYQSYTPHWNEEDGTFDQFASELNHWYSNHDLPSCCDGDTTYFLNLQKERLKHKHLKMTHVISPSKSPGVGTVTYTRKSLWYTTDTKAEQIQRHIAFTNNEGEQYQRDLCENMYQTIIHSPNEEQLEHMRLTCPNCGAVSFVSDLTSGCKYCDTCFKITDLFPRVTNQYFIKTVSSNGVSNLMKKSILSSMLVVFVISLLFTLPDKETALPLALLASYFLSLFIGGILGFLISEGLMLYSVIHADGRKRIPFFKSITAKGKITRTLRRYDPYFSFEKFEGQIVSLVRMCVFAKHPETLTACNIKTRDSRFEDIVEMTHISSFVVKNIKQSGNVIHLTLRTWWINYNATNNHVKKTGDCIDVTICRDISHPEAPGFSITSMNCQNCGGSFDAVRQRICPYCQTENHMEQESWIVEDLQLLR